MAKRMLVDATHAEETRVVVVNGNRLEELDFEIASRKQLKGNIYLAKVIRVEPSLQAAFVEYGGNRHGFLAFSEIHPDYYRIPVADREALLREQAAEAKALERAYDEAADDIEDTPQPQAVDEVGGPAANTPPFEADAYAGDVDGETGDSADAGEPGADPEAGAEGVTPLATAPEEETAGAKPKRRTRAGTGRRKPAKGSDAAAEAAPETPAADTTGADTTGDDKAGDDKAGGKPAGRGRRRKAVPASVEGQESIEEEVGGEERPQRRRHIKSYKIQEVIKRRQILLVQVTKEERGNKGAALTTYLSLPGRYCVLMPNTPRGGGISRKITNPADRKRMKDLLEGLDVPDGMSVILRTAGIERSKPEIKRDLEYLMRLWDSIRELTLQSVAPALIYEEANLIKRAIRDLYGSEFDDVQVEGEAGYRTAKDFMRMLMPSHAKKVQLYKDDTIPLFHRFQVEGAIEAMYDPVVQLRSGGYIVINQTEALVAIDVNSGRSTKERNIEETALKTNLEAAEEVARQLRLRDLAGLIVIDFIDMEDGRNNAAVEKRLKEAMKADRARIQLGRISPFGLLELSRQRLRPSLQEINFERCPHCGGTGLVRSLESAALAVLRAIEEEGIRRRSSEITVTAASSVVLYILNQKRDMLADIERRYGMRVYLSADDSLTPPTHRLERIRAKLPGEEAGVATTVSAERVFAETDRALEAEEADEADEAEDEAAEAATEQGGGDRAQGNGQGGDRDGRRRRRRRRRGRGDRFEVRPEFQGGPAARQDAAGEDSEEDDEDEGAEANAEGAEARQQGQGEDQGERRRRRRGKRGGRRRSKQFQQQGEGQGDAQGDGAADQPLESPEAIATAVGAETVVAVTGPAPVAAEQAEAADADAPRKRAARPRRKAEAEAAPATEVTPEVPAAESDAAGKRKPARGRRKAAEPEAEAAPAPAPTAETAPEAPAAEASTTPAEEAQEPAVNPYVVVNPPVEKPKKGWWSKLIKS